MRIGNRIRQKLLIINKMKAKEKIGKQIFRHGVQVVASSNLVTQTKKTRSKGGFLFLQMPKNICAIKPDIISNFKYYNHAETDFKLMNQNNLL